ncbi:hypothetical protein DFP93_10869 [Aneurinibacillus soli]|uniref:Uncharacterized protein n=1 Tax=Aneurinibacillus soli TaxID=1500254 RepID=A0A0U5ARV5_9BACL|nr:hypothetical protein [Aneurinibacillus soli]PYE61496.1 hypothetical protein DFP93_10869 [Aneurinibacillus soli]BAU26549.1 hypothetical protein CB4_00676 [Aneurinibacillus soli]
MLKNSHVEYVQEDGAVQLPGEVMARSGIGPNDSIVILVTQDGEIVLQKCANRETDRGGLEQEAEVRPMIAEEDESYGIEKCKKAR